MPNKFYPLDIDYGPDDDAAVKLDASAGSRSTLPDAVQQLMRLIFDIESMKKAMLEFEVKSALHCPFPFSDLSSWCSGLNFTVGHSASWADALAGLGSDTGLGGVFWLD